MRSVKKWVAGLGLGSGILYLSKDYIQEGLNDLMGMIVDKVPRIAQTQLANYENIELLNEQLRANMVNLAFWLIGVPVLLATSVYLVEYLAKKL